ncbi:TPA: transcriptional regulator [Proteus mirabilis]|uniref:transcriptional regulator n=1 Tax=Proteus mirabilis TaxID=584 RepID=UPI00217E6B97|nr:transcriptional regulator [Proteus mirabilis]MCS6748147.1 transcriptional regulator [Proteus mirabilis]HEK2843853.1 transcriptional regulator [Proteus mirabilis]
MVNHSIRKECLVVAELWTPPTGDEIRQVLKIAGFTGSAAAKKLGLGKNGDRTVRRWVGEDYKITYSAWALLCNFAGLGDIWIENGCKE